MNNFPGYLGYGGIIAIHADWPNYPSGIGYEIALKALGNFPSDTRFYVVDDIDTCILFIDKDSKQLKDKFDYKHFHLAIWHEDLIKLNQKGLITGIKEVSEYEYELEKFENLKKQIGENLKLDENDNIILYYKNDNNEYIETKLNKPINPDEDFVFNDFVLVEDYIKLTEKGIQELILIANNVEFIDELSNLVTPFIDIKRYDTAIREAALLIESKIKTFENKPDFFGQKLVDYHIKELVKKNNNFNSSFLKVYRGELRTLFKFIRNDFAHNFKVLTIEQANLILSRINEILLFINSISQ